MPRHEQRTISACPQLFERWLFYFKTKRQQETGPTARSTGKHEPSDASAGGRTYGPRKEGKQAAAAATQFYDRGLWLGKPVDPAGLTRPEWVGRGRRRAVTYASALRFSPWATSRVNPGRALWCSRRRAMRCALTLSPTIVRNLETQKDIYIS
jgi:hypothetical protein